MAKKAKRELSRAARAVRLACFIAATSLLCVGAFCIYRYFDTAINDPSSLFDKAALIDPVRLPTQAAVTPESTEVDHRGSHAEPTATAELSEYDIMGIEADKDMLNSDIVNILIIGVDYAYEREDAEWISGGGKGDFHSDVMMVLAVNFKENKASLISLPRDTYAKIPGVGGIYKLNASINCGGGVDDKGFSKVCEAAEWMLGGISVDYYYAVTMPAVKMLGDAVGGVDYDVEMDFKMAGRQYYAGQQHLNGQGILDYFRVRKGIKESGDLNRINRQKKMLVALFAELKQANKLGMIPDLLSISKEIYTNATLQQTIALAYFAYGLEVEDIGMYSMGGTMQSIFGWSFCLTDQAERVRVIKEVYGIDAEPYLEYTRDYANYRWQSMLYDQYEKTTEGLQEFVEKKIAADFPLPPPTPTPVPTATPTVDPSASPTVSPDVTPNEGDFGGRSQDDPSPTGAVRPTPGPSAPPTEEPTEAPSTPSPAPSASPAPTDVPPTPLYDWQARALLTEYIQAKHTMERAYIEATGCAELFLQGRSSDLLNKAKELAAANERFRLVATAMAERFGWEKRLEWNIIYWKDPAFNEILVDFR